MAGQNLPRSNSLIVHLPTFMLAIGYICFWLELFVFKNDQRTVSMIGCVLFATLSFWMIKSSKDDIRSFFKKFSSFLSSVSPVVRWSLLGGIAFGVLILLCGLYASLLPPHLTQEFDVLNYHLTLPRQHLLLGSFSHIPWSTADLYYLPIDFALAPFWLVSSLPNKFPQYLIFLGLLAVVMRLAYQLSNKNVGCSILAGLAILGSHNVGIQLGTGMLDLTICYLFFAALESFLARAYFISALELSFYFWSKSFMPIQFSLSILFLVIVFICFRIFGFSKISKIWESVIVLRWREFQGVILKVFLYFLFCSVLVGGPFVAKSLYYAGTPAFPFAVGLFEVNPINNLEELKQKSEQILGTRDQYGSGRGIKEFIQHLWLVAVPEKGVNNRYDYPIGFVYLLFVGPFLVLFLKSLKEQRFAILPILAICSWLVWWMGSQQTRFLFVPLIIMYLATIVSFKNISKVLAVLMSLAVLIVAVSVLQAQKGDWGKWGYSVLRPQDQALVTLGKQSKQVPVTVDFFDAAFADFPIEVKNIDSIFVLKH